MLCRGTFQGQAYGPFAEIPAVWDASFGAQSYTVLAAGIAGRHLAPHLRLRWPHTQAQLYSSALSTGSKCQCKAALYCTQLQTSGPFVSTVSALRLQCDCCLSDETSDASRRWCRGAEMEAGKRRAASTRAAKGHCARDWDQLQRLGAYPVLLCFTLSIPFLHSHMQGAFLLWPCCLVPALLSWEAACCKLYQAGRTATLPIGQDATATVSDDHGSTLFCRWGNVGWPGQRRPL